MEKTLEKSSWERYYRTSGVERGGLSSIPQLKEEGRLHGIITCGWDTDRNEKRCGKAGHACTITRPTEARELHNTQIIFWWAAGVRCSRKAALWGISLVAQTGCAPLLLCRRWIPALSTGTSGGLVESWNRGFYAGREQGLTFPVFISLSPTPQSHSGGTQNPVAILPYLCIDCLGVTQRYFSKNSSSRANSWKSTRWAFTENVGVRGTRYGQVFSEIIF